MALIEADQIVEIIGGTLTEDDEAVIEYYLDFAKGELEAYLGRPLEPTEFTETVVADADQRIYLSETPVISVESVTIEGTVEDSDNYNVTPWGIELAGLATFGSVSLYDFDDPEIVVVYTAGLDTPNAINSVLAAVVARQWGDRVVQQESVSSSTQGIKEMRVEDYSIEYDNASTNSSSYYGSGANPIMLFRHEADFKPVKRYKRRAVS